MNSYDIDQDTVHGYYRIDLTDQLTIFIAVRYSIERRNVCSIVLAN